MRLGEQSYTLENPPKIIAHYSVAGPVESKGMLNNFFDLKLDSDEYYIIDLIGSRVFLDDGTYIGELVYIDNFGSADIFTVKGKRNVSFPFLKRLELKFDKEAGEITISKARFEEVCCYED